MKFDSHGATELLYKALAGMYLLEVSVVLAGMALYKTGDSPLASIFMTGPGYGLLLAAILFFAAVVLLLRSYSQQQNKRPFFFSVVLNLASVLLLIVVMEGGLRVALTVKPGVASIFPRGFLPRDWGEVAATNRALLSAVEQGDTFPGSFLVFDEQLGWVPGPGRSSENGLYLSSVEGIRSGATNYSFRDSAAPRAIALVGDSYTFGLGVALEDTWGFQLEERLGQEFQVLNFGVGGYGVDQAYLRYLKDVRSWKPEILILGLISHDLYRSQVVYPFISFPSWQLPFAKPRFVLKNAALTLDNVPLRSPETIFAATSVTELPMIGFEPGYFAPEWVQRWYHGLFSVRFLISISPRWPGPEQRVPDSRIILNAAIISAFVDAATSDGNIPNIVFFPSYGAGELGRPRDAAGNAKPHPVGKVLARAGVGYLDLSTCLQDLPAAEGIGPDGVHYSPLANALVADCIHDYLRQSGLTP